MGRQLARKIHKQEDEIKIILNRPEKMDKKAGLDDAYRELENLNKEKNKLLEDINKAKILGKANLDLSRISFGAKVIGPRTGSFADYSHDNRLNVYCYDSLNDIQKIVEQHIGDVIDADAYHKFLEANDWPHFALTLLQLLSTSA